MTALFPGQVFLAGEWQHGGVLALLFALFHRHSYSGSKPAIGDILWGLPLWLLRSTTFTRRPTCGKSWPRSS